MKKFLIGILISMFLFTTSASAMTLAWDAYTDPIATNLAIYVSQDNNVWSILVDNIPTASVASEIPDHQTNNQRMYYMMRAFDSVNNEESANSESVSFYWTADGGGFEGPAGVGGIRLLDCSILDGTPDDGSPDWALCDGRHNK